MSQIKTTILEEQEFSKKEIEAMPETETPENIDPNIEQETSREEDDERLEERYEEHENNFINSL